MTIDDALKLIDEEISYYKPMEEFAKERVIFLVRLKSKILEQLESEK